MKPRTRNRIVSGALAFLVVLAVVGALVGMGAPAARAETALKLTGVSAPAGMATDQARERYWVLASTSGRLTLAAFKADGTPEGRMNSRDSLTNAQALAFVGGDAFVGDVGGSRAEVSIYRVIDPWPEYEINKAIRYRLAYPDGSHDAAAILVDADQRLFVVTRGNRPGIYAAPQAPSVTEASRLTRVADAPAGVTDAQVLVDGRVALRSTDRLVVLERGSWAQLAEAPLPTAEKGQSLAQSFDEQSVLTAAGAGGLVTSVPLPGQPPVQPTARTTRGPDSNVAPVAPEDTRTFSQTGTTAAVVGALALAALASSFVLVRR